MGHLVARYDISLALLTPLTHSAALCFAQLAPFMGSLTHFAHSLVEQLKFLNICSRCKRVQWEQTCFSSSLDPRPHKTKEKWSVVEILHQKVGPRCSRIQSRAKRHIITYFPDYETILLWTDKLLFSCSCRPICCG